MRRSHNRVPVAVTVVALVAGIVAGCGGSGRKRPLRSECLDFQGSAPPAASKVVARHGSGSTCAAVQVELVLTDVADVQTVEFAVIYDPDVTQYEGLSLTGSVLRSGGATVNVLENEGQGKVTINLARLGSGIDFSGSGTLVRLIFSPVPGAPATISGMSFDSTLIFGSETPPQEKLGIQWIGGDFQVTMS